MALPHQSIATISSPQFINLQPLDINPFMSACEIKVFYLGENRNGTFISKDAAKEMSKHSSVKSQSTGEMKSYLERSPQ